MRENGLRIPLILASVAAAGLLINAACGRQISEPSQRAENVKSSNPDLLAPRYIPAAEIPIVQLEPHLTAYIQPGNPNVA